MSPILRRHPFLVALASLIILAGLAIAILLLTFDLNRYREQVQERFAVALGRPITLGEAHLSLRHGIALTFSAISIPETANALWSLEAGSLRTKLQTTALLRGKLEFSEIVLLSPRLSLVLQDQPASAELPEWQLADVGALTIRDGSVTVEDRRPAIHPLNLTLTGVHLRLLDFAQGKTARLTVAAQIRQDGGPADLNLAGEISPAAAWRQSSMHLALKLEHLDAAVLPPLLPQIKTLDGFLSMALNLTGSTAAGLKIGGELSGEKLIAAIPAWYEKSLAIKRLRITGAWTQESGENRLRGFTLNVDDLTAGGDLMWRREEKGFWLEGTLATPPQSIVHLARLLPDSGPAGRLKEQLVGGTWQIENLRYAGPLADLDFAENLPLQGKVHIQNLQWRDADKRLGAFSFSALFDQKLLQVEGKVDFFTAPLRIAGTVEYPFSPQREITAEAEGILSATRLLAELPPERREKVTASGPLPILFAVEGTPEKLKYALDAKLNEINFGFGETLNQPAPLAGILSLAGIITPERLELGRARLQTAFGELRGKGGIERAGSRQFSLALEFADVDLEKLRPHLAFIDKIAGRGFLDGTIELAGTDGQLRSRTGTVRLREVAMHLPAIAPLSRIDGSLKLSEKQAGIEHLSAYLGDSPLTITGYLSGGDSPVANLHVRGKSIRADELIFASGQMLHDVDGKLRIDGQGIEFAPANVRLDGGTEASVRGKVTFAPPAVNLDIKATRGNIDEVIALWQKPTAGKEKETEKTKTGVAVKIKASVGEGTLGDLHFHQAEGEISYRHDLLEILPLQFQVGPGKCQSRIAVEFSDDAPPLLKASGHMEDVDAAAVYQQLLKKRGLISGTLRGDFYLEGQVGKEFLKTSAGGFSLETRDGVLHKFAVLGKIFSLLNVSQIFTLQLPDMARNGMPFERLTGNFALRQGILTTEDLFVKSPAMNLSVVGSLDLPAENIDMIMGIKPLRTVDKIVTSIPLAGWILTGEEKALVTIHFRIHGNPDRPEIEAVPITSLSEKVFGIFRRAFNLPGKVIDNVGGRIREK